MLKTTIITDTLLQVTSTSRSGTENLFLWNHPLKTLRLYLQYRLKL